MPSKIRKCLTATYGSEAMSDQAVRKWCCQFKNGCTSVFDKERAGQLVRVLIDEVWKKTDTAIEENRNVLLSLLAD